jgi:hypothetical protein
MHLLSLILFAAVLVGCSRTSPPRTTSGGVLDEARVLAIARAAVATNDTWLDRAKFETPDHETNGWSVLVWRLPKMPGGHRLILIDETGRVTDYIRGK